MLYEPFAEDSKERTEARMKADQTSLKYSGGVFGVYERQARFSVAPTNRLARTTVVVEDPEEE